LRTSAFGVNMHDFALLAMRFFRTHLSAAVAWAMIPVAAWAGMPSTGCVCANGHIKFFCQHLLKASAADESQESGCKSACCPEDSCPEETALAEQTGDCCGGGACCHGAKSDKPGVRSAACCQPIVTAPSVAPQIAGVPSDHAIAVATVTAEVGALVHPSLTLDVAEFDTGPPLDRVIVFRSLLI
jgi:hypothetical protein